jgi:hypothetical protein
MIEQRIRVMPAVMALFGLPFLWEDAQALPVAAATTASYDPAQPGIAFCGRASRPAPSFS